MYSKRLPTPENPGIRRRRVEHVVVTRNRKLHRRRGAGVFEDLKPETSVLQSSHLPKCVIERTLVAECGDIDISAHFHTRKALPVDHGKAALADVGGKLPECRFEVGGVGISIGMIPLEVGHYGAIGTERQKTSAVLAGFGDEIPPAAEYGVADARHVSADMRRKRKIRLTEHRGNHRRRRRFSVRTRNRHDGVELPTEFCQKSLTRHRCDPVVSAVLQLGIVMGHGKGIDDQFGVDRSGLMPDPNFRPPFVQLDHAVVVGQIGTRNPFAPHQHQFGKRRHTDAARPYEVNRLYRAKTRHSSLYLCKQR